MHRLCSSVARDQGRCALSGLRGVTDVDAGTIWGLPKARLFVVRRKPVDLQVDRSAYFTSDRTAIKATMRVGFAFPQVAAIQKVALSGETNLSQWRRIAFRAAAPL